MGVNGIMNGTRTPLPSFTLDPNGVRVPFIIPFTPGHPFHTINHCTIKGFTTERV